jgi:hypothetical protein
MQAVAEIVVRRTGRVFVERAAGAAGERGVRALEGELAMLGFAMDSQLRQAVCALGEQHIADLAQWLVPTLAEQRGETVHIAQLRQFPRLNVDTDRLYVERMVHWLLSDTLQDAKAPCLVCGEGAVHALDPCAHLVCDRCFDGSNYSGCPICHRAVDMSSPFFRVAPERAWLANAPAPELLGLAVDLDTEALAVARSMTRAPQSLSAERAAELAQLADHLGERLLDEPISVRATRAIVCASALRSSADPAGLFARLVGDGHVQTATDVLRTLTCLHGGDAQLTGPRVRMRISRPLRRAALAALEQMEHAMEDMLRHRTRWLQLGEALHPFEHHERFPRAAAAFAALRRTRAQVHTALARTLVASGHADIAPSKGAVATLAHVQIKPVTHASLVEAALAAGDSARAAALLAERPGELARRFDHLARISSGAEHAALLSAVDQAAPKLAGPLALTLAAHMRARKAPMDVRMYLPRGTNARAQLVADDRSPLDAPLCDAVEQRLHSEMVRRARAMAPVSCAVIDSVLREVPLPAGSRTASASRLELPRGSRLQLPDERRLRLMLHWTEPSHMVGGREWETRGIDLDLSVALLDASWSLVDMCDYTSLHVDGAIHSGDRTSAPPPHGSSEFVDLDLDRLHARGVRYAVMVVFSYNNVPFDVMDDAFAGFMGARDQSGEIFDARTVVQRFDLTSSGRSVMPMLVDLDQMHMRWLDMDMSVGDGLHSVRRHADRISGLASRMERYWAQAERPTLFEAAVLQACGRAERVVVLGEGEYVRQGSEQRDAFARRVLAGRIDSPASLDRLPDDSFAALVDASLPAGERCEVFSLTRPHTGAAQQLTASQLAGS